MKSGNYKKKLEARVGIEPTHKGFADLSLTTWVPRPCCLTLAFRPEKVHLRRTAGSWGDQEIWSGRRDLNPRLRPWQGRTLPLSYSRSFVHSTTLALFRSTAHSRLPLPKGMNDEEMAIRQSKHRPPRGGRKSQELPLKGILARRKSACLRFAAETSLGLSGLVSGAVKMRSNRSISAMVCSTSIRVNHPVGNGNRSNGRALVFPD